MTKKIKARIPDTQTMKGQLDKLGLTESQKFVVIQANRRGCLSLKWKAAEETSYHEGQPPKRTCYMTILLSWQ